MKRSDLGVVLFFYAVCVFFYVLIRDLPEEAQTYPTTILAALAVLNTVFLVRNLLRVPKEGFGNDLPVIFAGFQSRQFLGVIVFAVLYIAALPLLGFYITSLVFLTLCMLFLKVPKLHLVLTILVLAGLIYVVFSLFLKVPLPVGSLFV